MPWTPAPMSATRGTAGRRPVRREPAGSRRPTIAAVRSAVIGPPSRIASGSPVAGSLRTTVALIAGRPRAPFVGVTRRPTSCPRRSAAAVRVARRAGTPASRARTTPAGRGWTPIFGGSSAGRRRAPTSVRSARPEPLVERRHRRDDVGRRRGSEAAGPVDAVACPRVYARAGSALPSGRDDPDRRRPEPREPQARARRDRAVRRARRRSRRTRAGPRPSGRSPATSAATPRSGRRSCASSAPTCRRPAGRGCASGSSSWLARLFGTRAVADLVQALEGDEEAVYEAPGRSPEVARDRRRRARARRDLEAPRPAARRRAGISARGRDGVAIAPRARTERRRDRRARALAPGAAGRGRSGRSSSGSPTASSATCALVMGVAGARRASPSFILLAGIAGLLAGAFSMAAGEYISMQSQRELFERQIALERAELEAMPEEEQAELAAVYRAKGFTARRGGARSPSGCSRTRSTRSTRSSARSSGLDPDELGSPSGRAAGSFVAFADRGGRPGHPVPVRQRADGRSSPSLGLSLVALFAVGVGGEPADRAGRALLGLPPGRRSGAAAAGRDVRRRPLIGVSVT